MKKMLRSVTLILALAAVQACATPAAVDTASQAAQSPAEPVSASAARSQAGGSTAIRGEYSADDLAVAADDEATTLIQLHGDSATVEGSGVTIDGGIVTIHAGGFYELQGILDDGQIVVDSPDEETVALLLNGVDITNLTGAAIYGAQSAKIVLTLVQGTRNTVTDGSQYFFPDESDEPAAAIFSHDDLTINGSGALTVNANYKNGIASKDDLKIVSGTIAVNALADGIKGRDSISIKDGEFTINSGADGIQSTNASETGKGYILIEGGSFNITSALDGIQSEAGLQIGGGEFTITSGGGAVNNSLTGGGIWGAPGMEGNPNKPEESAKGLKAAGDVLISAGSFIINSADDSLHSNATLTIDSAELTLTSGDDGMHADSALTINAGYIDITQSYEGIESAALAINDGTIHVVSSDDGLNASGGNDASALGGRPGQGMFEACEGCGLTIAGGYLFVDARGDAIDINGPIEMSGGTVIANGPTSNGNGALDYTGSFVVSGGYLLAVGSAGMAMAPSASSSQVSFMYNFDQLQAAGSLVHVQTEGGLEVLTFAPTKEYQSVVLSSSNLADGATYVVFTGGASTGSNNDGLFSGGAYAAGSQIATFTTSGMVTTIGAVGMGGPTGGMGPGGRPAGGPPGGVMPTPQQ